MEILDWEKMKKKARSYNSRRINFSYTMFRSNGMVTESASLFRAKIVGMVSLVNKRKYQYQYIADEKLQETRA